MLGELSALFFSLSPFRVPVVAAPDLAPVQQTNEDHAIAQVRVVAQEAGDEDPAQTIGRRVYRSREDQAMDAAGVVLHEG